MKKIILFICCALLVTSLTAHAEEVKLKDGVYEGAHGFIMVEIKVADGNVISINIIEHGSGGEEYAKLAEPIIDEIIEKQSTEIDAVTGADISHEHLIMAVNDALAKALAE